MQLVISLVILALAVTSNGAVTPKELLPIGSFDGRTYYANHAKSVSYVEARAECELWGMQMLTIRSVAELEYLLNLLPPQNRYWTSAKDTGVFKWNDGTGEVVDEAQYPIVDFHGTCIIINNRRLIADPCDATLGHVYHTFCSNIPASQEN